MKIGSVQIHRIEEYQGPAFAPMDLLPNWTADAIETHLDWLLPSHLTASKEQLIMSCHSWLLKTPHHTILIDACTGNHKSRPGGAPLFDMLDRPYLGRLAAAGVAPEEIDYVLCTHLHADHVGWNTRLHDGRWVPTFPNAKYVMSGLELSALQSGGTKADFATWGSLFYEDSILPVLQSRQEMLIEGGFQIGDTLFAESTPGHSPAHLMFALRDQSEEALFSGDIMHHPIQVSYPEWSSAFCIDAAEATATRIKVMERAVENRSLLLPAHFAARGACCITHDASGFHCQGLDAVE